MTLVKIGTGSRIPPPEGPFQISFWGLIAAHDQDIFKKFDGYVDNGLPKCVWNGPNMIPLKINFWRTTALYQIYNIPAVNFNVVS